MNLKSIRDLVRLKLRDTRTPYAWEDAELNEYINAAVAEACQRSRLIYDPTIAITTVAGTQAYLPPYAVQHIDRAFYVESGIRTSVSVVGTTDLARRYDIANPPSGTPTYLVRRPDSEYVELWPIPEAAGSLELRVFRGPADTEIMVYDTDEPAIPEEHHRDLIYWVLREAYSVHDADVQDKSKALENEAAFERKFGMKPNARMERHARVAPLGRDIHFQRFGG